MHRESFHICMYMSDAQAKPGKRGATTYAHRLAIRQACQAGAGSASRVRVRACAHILHTERARCCVWWHGATIEGHIWANPDDCTIVLESSCHKVHRDFLAKKDAKEAMIRLITTPTPWYMLFLVLGKIMLI